MKTIFTSNKRGKAILYILFAAAFLSFAVLFFYSSLLSEGIWLLALTFAFIGIVFLGGLIIAMRSGPPW